jgi:hypothetical protein
MKIIFAIALPLLLSTSLKAQFANEELAHLKIEAKIKNEHVYSYPVKNGVLTGDSLILSSRKYDVNGYLVEEYDYDNYRGNHQRYVYTYKNDKLVEIEIFNKGNKSIQKIFYSYNPKGLLSKKVNATPDGYPLKKEKCRYNERKQMVKIIQENNRHFMLKERRFYKNGKLHEIWYYNKESEKPVSLSYDYNAQGRLVKTTHHAFGASNVIEEKDYNEENLCIEKRYAKYFRILGIRLETKENIIKNIYLYNPDKTVSEIRELENNQLIEVTKFFYDNL